MFLRIRHALIYYFGPDVKQDYVFVTLGSVLGVALLVGASLVFAWYVQNLGDYAATYGSVGAVILLLLWLYIAGLTILFGAEVRGTPFTRTSSAAQAIFPTTSPALGAIRADVCGCVQPFGRGR